MRFEDLMRWHVEKHLLSVMVPADRHHLRTRDVAGILIPLEVITPQWRCYSVGVGEDIRLDRYLSEDCGAEVWAFDPTPRAIKYMQTAHYDRRRLHFMPIGVWDSDTTLRFHAPENPRHVSHTVMKNIGGSAYFDASCRAIPSLMRELGHDRVDLLKLNIEGAEDVVLRDVIDAGLTPQLIALTYEGDGAFAKAREWTRRLRALGYVYVGRIAWYFTYVRAAA